MTIFKGNKIATKTDNKVYEVIGFSLIYYIVRDHDGKLKSIKRSDAIKLS